jgi:hypothetical protein
MRRVSADYAVGDFNTRLGKETGDRIEAAKQEWITMLREVGGTRISMQDEEGGMFTFVRGWKDRSGEWKWRRSVVDHLVEVRKGGRSKISAKKIGWRLEVETTHAQISFEMELRSNEVRRKETVLRNPPEGHLSWAEYREVVRCGRRESGRSG